MTRRGRPDRAVHQHTAERSQLLIAQTDHALAEHFLACSLQGVTATAAAAALSADQIAPRIETVFGQLVRRFHAKQVWPGDVWHLSSRWLSKIRSQIFDIYCCQLEELDSALAFDRLLSS